MTVTGSDKRWRPAAVPEATGALEAAGISPRLAPLLARRGVGDPEAAERFLHPSVEHLHDPFTLEGLDAAVDRLLAARDRGEKVAVVGDYDVDGVSSTALLTAVFQVLGIETEAVLPHRLRDGYGFQTVHVERAREAGCSVILTADCGTTSVTATAAAQEAGMDVVVTDHHLPGAVRLPAGTVLINPKQDDCGYPFRELAAVGLALKLALGLVRRTNTEIPLDALLRVACLGTIADLVPLVDENRVIAALGLEALARTRSVGLKALFRRAGVTAPFTATDVGFRIGPRLNAAGRLDDASAALELLLTRDPRRADALAEDLDRWNRERQDEEQRVVDEARRRLQRDGSGPTAPPIAVLWSEGWHRGVVGIAAGRIARELHRPALLLAVEGDSATGSGRSIPGIDLHGFLEPWKPRLERFGGHTQAVGLTADLETLPELTREWSQAAGEWSDEVLTRTYEWELEVPAGAVGPELLTELSQLEPHGMGNRRPLLKVGPLELAGPPRLFGRGHLSAVARGDDGAAVRLLGWRWAEREDELAGVFEVLGYVEKDTYRGGEVLRLVDARTFSASRPSSGVPAKKAPGP